jgi:acyl-CoA dehydrogenase
MFVIDRNTPGITATKLNKLGWRASDTGEIGFDDVRVPATALMGQEGSGFYYIMQKFALERIAMAIGGMAASEHALQHTLKYISEREAFGRSINKFQVLRHTIAQLASEIEMQNNSSITSATVMPWRICGKRGRHGQTTRHAALRQSGYRMPTDVWWLRLYGRLSHGAQLSR